MEMSILICLIIIQIYMENFVIYFSAQFVFSN